MNTKSECIRRATAIFGKNTETIGKPSWSMAPEWANYLHLNVAGLWEWTHAKPTWDWLNRLWNSDCTLSESSGHQALSFTKKQQKDSLERRPTTEESSTQDEAVGAIGRES